MTTTKTFNVYAATKSITEEDGTLFIEGIANTGQKDLVGDVVTESALQQIVEQAPQRNLHYNHYDGRKDILGRIVESELRSEGAWIKTRILGEQAEWLKSYLDQGIIFGQSISGCCTYEEGSWENITEWELTEVSLTDTPCDPATMGTVAISKSFDDIILALKQKEETIDNELENENMAEELTKDDVISIVNDAFNERKEELLEQVRDEVGKEYDAKINELSERIQTLESKLDDKPGEEGEEGGEPGKEDDKGEDDKAFQEALDKAVNEKVNSILKGLRQTVESQYDGKEHIKNTDNLDTDKAYNAHDIAKML